MTTTIWDSMTPLLAVLTPLVGVPLALITFYLRSLREQQLVWHEELSRRLTALESAVVELRRLIDDFERSYTTKEEWLRECLHARRLLEHLSDRTARLTAAHSSNRRRSSCGGRTCRCRASPRRKPPPLPGGD